MLDSVEAVGYRKVMSTGRNRPLLLEVERQNGEIIEAVVKPGTSECGNGGLIREAVASLLAADLDLPVPEPFVVHVTPEFLKSLPSDELRARLPIGATSFGCRFVPGMNPYVDSASLTNAVKLAAVQTFSFDAGILNQDRRVSKPNCLTNGAQLLLIDHELSLNVHGIGGILNPNPWEGTALQPMTTGATEHAFFRRVRREPLDVRSMLDRLSQIPRGRVDAYVAAVPPAWDCDNVLQGIAAYIEDLISHAVDLRAAVEGALA